MTDAEVEAKLFRDVGRNEPPARVPIDFAWVHRELSRVGVTLQTLWVEYREGAASAAPLRPYEYSRFCGLYARWRKKLAVSMRQVHRAGEKLFIDYSGKKLGIVDRSTGEVTEVEIFVAVLGASNYTTPRRRAHRSSPTSSRRRCGSSSFSAASLRSSSPTSFAARSPGRIATSPTSIRPTSRWRSTTA